MENLRWILIFAGVAILALLYLADRKPKGSRRQSDSLDRSQQRASKDTRSAYDDDVLLNGNNLDDPLDNFNISDEFDIDRPAPSQPEKPVASAAGAAGGGLTGISSKIEALGSKIAPRRKKAPALDPEVESKRSETFASKIVTLHVAAPEGQLINGAHLLEQFEQRGYHFGDMSIFHSMHEGKTVFSIAKMVMPGTFDINDVDSFQTPGISMILQLPGPVAADVAFEVLLSEAHEIADTLGAMVLDSDRSSLSKQTVQHMREGINEYMHKQKYFDGVPS